MNLKKPLTPRLGRCWCKAASAAGSCRSRHIPFHALRAERRKPRPHSMGRHRVTDRPVQKRPVHAVAATSHCGWDVTASWLGGAARFRHPLQARCAAEKGTTSLPRNSRLANFPDLARAWAWRTNLAASRPITAMPIAGGPLRSGTHDRTLEHRRRWEPSTPSEPVRSGVQT